MFGGTLIRTGNPHAQDYNAKPTNDHRLQTISNKLPPAVTLKKTLKVSFNVTVRRNVARSIFYFNFKNLH